jgi:uncharacterized membrane protein
MISVKRFSVVLGLIYGVVVFKEKNGVVVFKEKNIAVRTSGTLLMVAGAVLIAIWGE